MKAGTVIDQDVQVTIPLVFKVNKETREVEGIATQEVVDVHGEIVDHESMKAVLADWPGNIREMHQPKAVGKAVKVVSDDEAKATILRARISKGAQDTYEKVLDGTLSMFSIGGTGKRVTTKTADGNEEKRILMSALHEISLVDNGACPTARFEIVKMVDGVSTHVQPEDPEDPPAAAVKKQVPLPTTLADALRAQPESGMGYQLVDVEFEDGRRLENIPAVNALYLEVPAEFESAMPKALKVRDEAPAKDAKRKPIMQLLVKAITGELVRTPKAQLVAKAAAVALGTVPETRVLKAYPEVYDISAALSAIAALEQLIASEWWEARNEAVNGEDDDAQTAQSQLAMLRAAAQLVMAFLLSEFEEQFSEFDEADAGDDTGTPIDIDNRADTRRARIADLVTTFLGEEAVTKFLAPRADVLEPATTDVDKKGARHSKADSQMIQGMHDSSVALGANCSSEKVAGVPATLALKEGEALVTQPAVEKLIADAVAQALAGQEATHTKAIATLEERIDKLAKTPIPGGPRTRATSETAVHKTVAGSGNPLEGVDPSQVTAFAEELARQAPTEAERERIIQNLIKFQHRTGTGAIAFRQRSGRTE